MSNAVVRIQNQENLHSPFSGQPAYVSEEPNSSDDTLLFIYHGGAGAFGYTSNSLTEFMKMSQDDFDIDQLLARLPEDNVVVFESNDGWNGLNYYGFAPHGVI